GLQAESTDADATELEVRLGGAKLDVEIEIGTRTEPDRGRGRGAAMTDAHATRLSQCLGAQRESRGAGIEPRHGCHTIGIVSEAKRVEDARRCRREFEGAAGVLDGGGKPGLAVILPGAGVLRQRLRAHRSGGGGELDKNRDSERADHRGTSGGRVPE